MAEEKETQDKIAKLQLIEQELQSFLMQKQNFQAQLVEIDSALKELDTSDEAYKIVGNIMVKSKKDDLVKDLKSKKEMVELRIKTIEKQENQIKEKANKIQTEVMEKLKK